MTPLIELEHDGVTEPREAIDLGECHKGLHSFIYVTPEDRIAIKRVRIEDPNEAEDAN